MSGLGGYSVKSNPHDSVPRLEKRFRCPSGQTKIWIGGGGVLAARHMRAPSLGRTHICSGGFETPVRGRQM